MSVKRLISDTAKKNKELAKIHRPHIASAILKVAGVCGLSEDQRKALEFFVTRED